MIKALQITVANAMKGLAAETGRDAFTHWFQPMTGITAEKHDSFISPGGDGRIIMEFFRERTCQGRTGRFKLSVRRSARDLLKARGYTAWDPSSYAFIKDHTLCIPTVFIPIGRCAR